MNAAQFYPHLFGTLNATAAAAGTVLYDCHVSIQDRLKRVPMPIYSASQAIVLALACGAVAAVAFNFTTGRGDTLIDSVLGLKQSNPYLRGLCVGLTVLVLIRSKLSSIKGAEIGGELAYNSGRAYGNRGSHRRQPCEAAFICLRSQILANAQSRLTDRGDTFRMSAISSMENPPK